MSIVVVSHSQLVVVERMLESMCRFEDISDFDVFIIEDNRHRILGSEPEFKLPHKFAANDEPNGYAANVNTAFTRTLGDYFCTINPYAIFTQEIFKSLQRDVSGGRADIVAPIVQDRRGKTSGLSPKFAHAVAASLAAACPLA